MAFLFLLDDLEKLKAKRAAINEKYRTAGAEAGQACSQGAETFHDNAAYDLAMQEMHLQGGILQEVDKILRDVEIVPMPKQFEIAAIGHIIGVSDTGGRMEYYSLRSFKVVDEPGAPAEDGTSEHPYRVTYVSPIGQQLNGKKLGHAFTFPAGPRARQLTIAEIR